MGRIRTVKPELFTHEELFDLERDSGLPIRFAFAGLFTCCDKAGRFKWKPRTLKLAVLPHDDIDFSRVLDTLATRGFIVKYASKGVEYGFIPTWEKHQIINNRETESDLPAPDESLYISMGSTREARVDDACLTPVKGKGREGKGKEGERKGKEITVEPNSLDHASTTEKPIDQARTIFTYWQKIMKSPSSVMDNKRKGLLLNALKNYSPADICKAIRGCSKSPHNMGQNDRNTKYNGLGLILRDAEHIDRFIGLDAGTARASKAVESIEEANARIMAEVLGTAPVDADIIDMEA